MLVDAHCHTVIDESPSREVFEGYLTESDRPAPPGVAYGLGPLGLAVLRWCAPALGLSPGATLDEYLAERSTMSEASVRTRLLSAAGLSDLLVDTGIGGSGFGTPSALAVGGARVHEVVRLEPLAEELARTGVDAAGFGAAFATALRTAAEGAVGVKSILAYRCGLDIPPGRPTDLAVQHAAAHWLRSGDPRLTEPILLRYLLWCAVDLGLPVQIHTGFGDPDLRLSASDPALLQPFLAAVESFGTPIVLLHCYPFQRSAGWLAAMFPHVYADVGLTLSHVGAAAPRVLEEFLELAPFGKLLFSTDAYGLPELYLVGAEQFRWSLRRVLGSWQESGAMCSSDADTITALIGGDTARRLYGLDSSTEQR